MATIWVDDVTVGEGDGTVTFLVRLDAASASTVTVDFATSSGTADYGSSYDYQYQTGTLSFAPGETVAPVTITLVDNDTHEVPENFFLRLSDPSDNATIAREFAIATIIDNDLSPDVPVDSQPIVSIGELVIDEQSGAATFVVKLDRPSLDTVSVNYSTQNGTAKAGSDYAAIADTLVFNPGEVVKTVKVAITNDKAYELSESFGVKLSGLVGATALDATATAIIFENDAPKISKPSVSVEDATVGEDQTYADFVVKLSGPATGTITVDYATSSGTADYGNNYDYQYQTGTLTFASGETVKTVRVQLHDDATHEATENFFLNLSRPSDNVIIARESGTATLIDNDLSADTPADAKPVVTVNDFVIDEQAREATFVVSLSHSSTETVSLNYATQDGTAKAGSDYTAASGSLVFGAGEVTKTIKVTLTNDSVHELSESFGLKISSLVGATTLDAVGTATIFENDAPKISKPSVSVEDFTVGEDQTYADVVIKLSGPATNTITVNYATSSGTADYGDNYDYQYQNGTLAFASGETVKTVRVKLHDDTTDEPTENLFLNLSSPSDNVTIARASGTITIIDNDLPADTPVDTRPLLSIGDLVVDEQSREASFVISLNSPSTGTVSLGYATQNGTAKAGSDYVPASGSLNFAAGEVSKTVKVTLTDDKIAEATESFGLKLSGVVGATVLDPIGTAQIYQNDAAKKSQPSLSVENVTIGEEQDYADFVVKLSGPATNTVTVNYRTDNGSASYSRDYQYDSGSLSFASGETVKTVRVHLTDDAEAESAENFNLNLYSPSANATIGNAIGTATLIDNDAQRGTPKISVSDTYVDESSGLIKFAVTLDRPSESNVAVKYATANGSATAGADYQAASGVLAFASGEVSKEVVVGLIGDTKAEKTETFKLLLSGATGGAKIDDPVGTGVIVANDAKSVAGPVISVKPLNGGAVSEGAAYAEFLVSLSAPSTAAIGVSYNTANGTASYSDDFQYDSGTLRFDPGQTSQIVRLGITKDADVESPENFTLRLYSPTGGATVSTVSPPMTIIDDDEPNPPVLGKGLSDDIYTLSSGKEIIIDAGGIDEVRIAKSYALPGSKVLPDSIENLTLTGSGAYNGTGNSLDNVIKGNAAANVLKGGAGNDKLDGGAGADTLDGGSGKDSYYVDRSTDKVVEAGASTSEIDTVYSSVSYTLGKTNIENLVLTGKAVINGAGNGLNNGITGNAAANKLSGAAGNDTLKGAAGNDTLDGGAGNDKLDGGVGKDKMVGGSGNDTYYRDSTGDTISETGTSSKEIDTVVSSLSYSLGKNLENLTLSGSAALSGTGNSLANVLLGNAANNALSGGAGNDTLSGGLGNDKLTGGSGGDTFKFNTKIGSGNVDTMTDFNASADKIWLDDSVFTKLAAGKGGVLASSQFVVGSKAVTASQHLIYNDDSGALYYDADGKGAGKAVQIATLDKDLSGLGASDFLVG